MPRKDLEEKKAYQRDYQRGHKLKRRSEIMAGRTCVECSSEHDVVLRKANHESMPKYFWTFSRERQAEVLKTCMFICRACYQKYNRARYAERLKVLVVKSIERRNRVFGDPETRTQKRCSLCKQFLDLSVFGKCRRSKDKRTTRCKPCDYQRVRKNRLVKRKDCL